MKLINGVILEQRQILTQYQIQSLDILAMNNQELDVFMQNEILENPMLEYKQVSESVNNPADFKNFNEKSIICKDRCFASGDNDDRRRKHILANEPPEIRESIMTQLYHERRTEDEWNLIDILIDCLDENGYFTLKPKEVSKFSGYPESLVIKCLKDLKELEPIGIFSENLSECLLKQLKASDIKDEKLINIVECYLTDIIKGRVSSVARALGISAYEMRMRILELGKLNPRPGAIFSKSLPEYIVPDAIMDFYEGQWVIELNNNNFGELKCNGYYLRLMRSSNDSELLKYLHERYERCRFVLGSIEQQKKTLLNIVRIIAEYQKEYFLNKQKLKPMSLSDIAIVAGVHPSTVSRAIKGKYIQYNFGTVLIKSLFSSYAIEKNGQKVSVERVLALIQEIVALECKLNPLSDHEILKEIEARGVKKSRRTIAKYRNNLGISDSNQRKYGL